MTMTVLRAIRQTIDAQIIELQIYRVRQLTMPCHARMEDLDHPFFLSVEILTDKRSIKRTSQNPDLLLRRAFVQLRKECFLRRDSAGAAESV